MAESAEKSRLSLYKLDAQYRLLISLIVSVAVYAFTRDRFTTAELVLVIWIAFALTVIILNWIIILTSHPKDLRNTASLQDSSRTFLFLFIIAASVMSLVAIAFLLASAKNHHSITPHVLLAIAAVIISWWLVQTVFTLRYAHFYYSPQPGDNNDPKLFRGLIFPHENDPDYMDFVYFGFVIGMTFQVSDVNVSSRRIRRLAWFHGLISFAFNTAILALSINVISGLIAS
jgi:uncharacterized membrane protein